MPVERYMSEIVERLVADTNAQITLLSPPVLGQELGSPPVLSAGAHSRVVYEIAAAYGIAYLPLFERQFEHLQSHGSRPTIAFRDDARLVYRSMLRRWVCGQSYDDISRQRGLQLITDFVHQNSCGAAIIADLIEDFLKTRVTWKPQLCN
jgi:hypothetical protein